MAEEAERPRIVVVAGGKPRPEWLAWVAGALGGEVCRVFSDGDALSGVIPECEFVVGVRDSLTHVLEDQLLRGKPGNARYLRLSRKTSVAASQLRRLGFFPAGANKPRRVDVLRGEEREDTVAEFPTLHRFSEQMVKRIPGLTLADAALVRHAERVTPFKLSRSITSVWQAVYQVERAQGREARPGGRHDAVVVLQTAADVMDSFGAVTPPKQSSAHAERLDLVRRWAKNLLRLGREPGLKHRGQACSRFFTRVHWPLPASWEHLRDARDAVALVEPSLAGKRPALGMSEMRAALLAATRGIEGVPPSLIQEVKTMEREAEARGAKARVAPRKPAVVRKPTVERKPARAVASKPELDRALALRAIGAAGYGEQAAALFFGAMFAQFPQMSLSDAAWLRQQSELWPCRVGGRSLYFGRWTQARRSACNVLHPKAARHGQLREVTDTDLLRAAYALLEGLQPPEVPAEESERLARIGRITRWMKTGPYHVQLVRTRDVLDNVNRSLRSDALVTREDLAEARDLLAVPAGTPGVKQLPADWLARLMESCRVPVEAEPVAAEPVAAEPEPEPVAAEIEPEPVAAEIEPEAAVAVGPEAAEPTVAAPEPPKPTAPVAGAALRVAALGDASGVRDALRPMVELAMEVMGAYGIVSIDIKSDGSVRLHRRVVVEAEDAWSL